MEFNARDDIEAPIEFVFDQVTNFEHFERSIMRRGGDVERVAGGDAPERGTKWRVKFRLRGRERVVNAEIVHVERPRGLSIAFKSGSADGDMVIELVALSRGRTRVIATVSGVAKTIPAKLFFQSLKFARAKTEAKFAGFVSGFARDTEQKFRG